MAQVAVSRGWHHGGMSKPARSTAARSSPRPAPVPLLVAVDLLALVVFVVTGMRSHHEGTYATIFLRNAIPLLGSWAVFSAVLGAYRYPGLGSLLRTWIVAVPVALVVRSLWVGSPTGVRPIPDVPGRGARVHPVVPADRAGDRGARHGPRVTPSGGGHEPPVRPRSAGPRGGAQLLAPGGARRRSGRALPAARRVRRGRRLHRGRRLRRVVDRGGALAPRAGPAGSRCSSRTSAAAARAGATAASSRRRGGTRPRRAASSATRPASATCRWSRIP